MARLIDTVDSLRVLLERATQIIKLQERGQKMDTKPFLGQVARELDEARRISRYIRDEKRLPGRYV